MKAYLARYKKLFQMQKKAVTKETKNLSESLNEEMPILCASACVAI